MSQQEEHEPLLWRFVEAALLTVLMLCAFVVAGFEILWELIGSMFK